MDFVLDRSVEKVKEACDGWGTDEDALIKVLCSLTKQQLLIVNEKYKDAYGKTLKEQCDDELGAWFGSSKHFADFFDVLLSPAAEMDAKYLAESMKGWGTDESLLSEILCTRTNLELLAAKTCFETKNSKSLEDWICSETDDDGPYKRFLLRCAKADRKEQVVDAAEAKKQAEKLGDLSDEGAMFEIIATASVKQLELIKAEYQAQHGKELIPAILEATSGDLEQALLARCQTRERFFAQVLIKAWSGSGTDEAATSRVFARCSKAEIKKISVEYAQITGVDMAQAIAKETSGLYKKALLRYLFHEVPNTTAVDVAVAADAEVAADPEVAPAE